jgi:resuscitation-promoting factor RpfA
MGKHTLLEEEDYVGRHRLIESTVQQLPKPISRAVSGILAASAVVVLGMAATSFAPPASATADSTWDRLAECESSGNWSINTGNGYYGGLQFSPTTWLAFGGGEFARYANDATRTQQIQIAERVLDVQGWGAWPACSRKLGLRGTPDPIQPEAPVSQETSSTVNADSHTVVQGETLSGIANDYNASLRFMVEENQDVVENPNLIYPGEELRVP